MKLNDIPPGSDLAYKEAVGIVIDQLIAEVETCKDLFGINPETLLALLAKLLTECVQRKEGPSLSSISRYLS